MPFDVSRSNNAHMKYGIPIKGKGTF